VRYRGLDAAKEGQLEARERLLADLEEKAKEKVREAPISPHTSRPTPGAAAQQQRTPSDSHRLCVSLSRH
jgi:hypothetical protein